MTPIADDVTVVVPVRNGGATLRRVLDGLVGQTLLPGHIIVSDNQSSDDTASIVEEYVAAHPQVSLVRQPVLLTAIDHFAAVYRMVETPFFMWAAHDDFHSPDYVETLRAALAADANLVGAFGELVVFHDGEDARTKEPLPLPCDTRGLSFGRRLKLVPEHHVSMATYGLWRTSTFADYGFFATKIAEDWVLMWFAMATGDMAKVPGPRFYYYVPAERKTVQERARREAYSEIGRFAWYRVYWVAAGAAAAAWARRHGRTSALVTFLRIAWSHQLVLLKQWVYARRPGAPPAGA